MKRLLHKNLWKAGLAVLAMMLLPTGTKADNYVSTFTGVAGLGPYTLQTEESNQWVTECGSSYNKNNGLVTINAPETANIISLHQLNGVYGAVYYFKIEGQAMNGTFSLRAYDYYTQNYITIVQSQNVSNSSSCELTIPEDAYSYGSDGYQLYLDFEPATDTGNSLTISKITVKTSRLSIISGEKLIYVTDVNANDVLNDNETVQFLQEDSVLILNEANIANVTEQPAITTTLPRLYVLLRNENSIKTGGTFFYFDSSVDQELVFMNEVEEIPNSSLTFSSINESLISKEDLFGTNRYSLTVKYRNGLALSADTNSGDTSSFTISGNINPIMDTVIPIVKVNINDEDYGDLDGVVISHVYYTLKKNNDPAKSEGYFDNSDGKNGIIIQVGLTDEEVEEAIESVPGSDDFNEKFRGITMMVPAGIGTMTINAKGNGAGAILKMKLGTMDAVAYPLTTDYADYTLDYQCTEPTYLYVYVLDQEPAATARPGGPNHEKVQTVSIKITGYKGNSAAVVNTVGGVQTASVYSLSCTGYKAGDDHVTMSTVEVAPAAVAAARPVGGPMHTPAPVSYPISSLGESVFAKAEKDKLLYIDLSGTQVKGIDVDRSSGIFNGINNATTIYLPDGNNDAGEPNVIINGECKTMTLDDSKTFKAPAGKTFKVQTVTLTRTTHAFVKDKPATVFLPFTIPASRASELGKFHTFKEISGDDAVFNTAESGDIAANTPYIFVPNNDGANITATDVTLNTTVPAPSGKLIGTFERIGWTTDPDDIYGFSAKDQGDLTQGQFFKVKASSYILPFRAYLKVTAATSRLRLVIGDDTTGITTISNPESEDNIWYSLDGQRHQGKPAKQGVYIHNNQKVLVK